MTIYCSSCCAERAVFEAQQLRGENHTSGPPEVEEAYTYAPSWQQTMVMGQMIMACVALPTCKRHLQIKEMSPADRAVLGGKIIPGRIGGDNGG
jgi:hypothetical protein